MDTQTDAHMDTYLQYMDTQTWIRTNMDTRTEDTWRQKQDTWITSIYLGG